jgi:hypothetical protein
VLGTAEVEPADGDAVALAALTVIVAAAVGFVVVGPEALPVTVSLTERTEVAFAATATCALSCVLAEVESTVPRSHEALPSGVQLKVNFGARLEGAVVRLRVTLDTLPAVAHALTVH